MNKRVEIRKVLLNRLHLFLQKFIQIRNDRIQNELEGEVYPYIFLEWLRKPKNSDLLAENQTGDVTSMKSKCFVSNECK